MTWVTHLFPRLATVTCFPALELLFCFCCRSNAVSNLKKELSTCKGQFTSERWVARWCSTLYSRGDKHFVRSKHCLRESKEPTVLWPVNYVAKQHEVPTFGAENPKLHECCYEDLSKVKRTHVVMKSTHLLCFKNPNYNSLFCLEKLNYKTW